MALDGVLYLKKVLIKSVLNFVENMRILFMMQMEMAGRLVKSLEMRYLFQLS